MNTSRSRLGAIVDGLRVLPREDVLRCNSGGGPHRWTSLTSENVEPFAVAAVEAGTAAVGASAVGPWAAAVIGVGSSSGGRSDAPDRRHRSMPGRSWSLSDSKRRAVSSRHGSCSLAGRADTQPPRAPAPRGGPAETAGTHSCLLSPSANDPRPRPPHAAAASAQSEMSQQSAAAK